MYGASSTTNYSYFRWMYPLSWSFQVGISNYAAMHHAWLFFPDKPGLSSGVILAGFGGGGFIFDILSTALINPQNIPLDSD